MNRSLHTAAPAWSVVHATVLGALVGALHALATAIVVTWNFRDHILAPPLAGRVQLFDPASKLLGFVHNTPGDFLQHFYGPGIAAKLPLFVELITANVVLGAAIGLVLGVALRLCPGAWAYSRRIACYAIGYLAIIGSLHVLTLIPIVVNPHDPRPIRDVIGQITRRMREEGPAIDLLLTGAALLIAIVLTTRSRRDTGPRAGLASAGAAAVAALVLISSVPTLEALQQTQQNVPAAAERTVRPRNVVLISIDSLRADHLSCYGYHRPTSPRLDALAAAGARFDAAYTTASWTLPSHASQLTGRYPLSHGAITLDRRLSTATPTIPTILGPAGFTTGGFVSFEFLRRRYGFDAGFDYFDDFTTAVDGNNEEHHLTTGPLLNAEIVPWINKHADRPFFLFVHNFDVHYDYNPPAPYDTMFDDDYDGPDMRRYSQNPHIRADMPARYLEQFVALYDGEIRFTDTVIGEIIDAIDRAGIGDDTLVIVVADHGEEFFDHGDRGHGTTMYEEVMRVPLIMRWPRGLKAGRTIDTPVSVVDLAPTIYDLTGVDGPAGLDGESLAALMSGADVSPRPIYGHLYARKRPIITAMVRLGSAKYVQDLREPHAQLFDLGSDPQEVRNALGTGDSEPLTTPMVAWLGQQWRAYRALPTATEGHIEVDQHNINRLRALGYVD
jgi:arylsulfatase A-like enzyme